MNNKPIRDGYFLKPKQARGGSCEAWWYARRGSITIYFKHADSPVGGSATLTRRQLVEFVERTKPKRKARKVESLQGSKRISSHD